MHLFENDVLTLLEEHFKTHDLALMSGGSMMYIDAVCDGMGDLPTVSDEERTEMKRRYAEEGLEALCEELRKLDPEYYEIVDKKNYRRVIHALEIIHTTGCTFTSLRTGEKKKRPFNIVKIGLNRDRNELYERINQRVDAMMRDGLLDEAKRWYAQREFQSLNTVGYKELFSYFDGQWSLEEAVERIKGNTRRYCRKQLTWCMFGGQSGFAGHITVGDKTFVGAQCGVNSSVKGNQSLIGSPAIEPKNFFKSSVLFKKLPDIYKQLNDLQKEVEELKSRL